MLGAAGNAKSGVERKYSTPPEQFSTEHDSPSLPSTLEKSGAHGHHQAAVQSFGLSCLVVPPLIIGPQGVGSSCGLPLDCIFDSILSHAAEKIK